MKDCIEVIFGMCAAVFPAMLSVDAESIEGWLKVGGLAALVFIMGRQLIAAYRRNDELLQKNAELMRMCKDCPLAQAANEAARLHITGEHEHH